MGEKEQWAYSFNDEDYEGCFDSKEEAIEEAKSIFLEEAEMAGYEPDDDAGQPEVWVGIAVTPPIEWTPYAEYYIESMQDHLEYYGELAENFPDQYSEDDVKELDRRLNDTVRQWLKDRSVTPGFFVIDRSEKIDTSDWIRGI